VQVIRENLKMAQMRQQSYHVRNRTQTFWSGRFRVSKGFPHQRCAEVLC
jgi:hypothetical protein